MACQTFCDRCRAVMTDSRRPRGADADDYGGLLSVYEGHSLIKVSAELCKKCQEGAERLIAKFLKSEV